MRTFGNANLKLGIITDLGEKCEDEVAQKVKFASWAGSEELVDCLNGSVSDFDGSNPQFVLN